MINTLVVATDPLKNMKTLDLSSDDNKDQSHPGLVWEKAKNSDKRFWFLEEVEQAQDALNLDLGISETGIINRIKQKHY